MNASQEVILSVDNIRKKFKENEIHRGISFSLHKGETLGLLGGSGAGKSVLLRSLIGLDTIDDGKILFHQERIDQLTEEQLADFRIKISYCFQTGALFDSISVFENIAYPLFEHTNLTLKEIEKKVYEMLKLIGLEDKGHIMPSDLSGGMQKRVGMARSMIMSPEIILYDEPTAGLDPSNTLNILNIMQSLKQTGISSIFVTHDIPAALKICDRILILDKGIIGFSGTPNELVSSTNPIVKNFFVGNS